MLYKLESLRGLAAIMVLFHHTSFTVFKKDTLLVESSWLLVDFFFVLSGFVMTLAYRGRIAAGLHFKQYIQSRIFRLVPLHWFVLIAYMPLILFKYYYYYSGHGGTDPALTENIVTFFVSLFFLSSLGVEGGWNFPSWSISAEFVVYILFYFIVKYSKDKIKLIQSSVFIGISTYVVSFFLYGVFVPFTWDYGFLRSVPAFMLGVFVCYIYEKNITRGDVYIHECLAIGLMFLSIILTSIDRMFAYLAIVSFMYAVYVFSDSNTGLIGRVLETRAARYLGQCSYSIYMVHMLVIVVVEDFVEHVLHGTVKSIHGIDAILINLGILIVVVILAGLTYRYVECPGREYGKLYIKKKTNS